MSQNRDTAHVTLTQHLEAHDPNEIPCLTYPHGGWTSDDHEEQSLVAKLCHDCPALTWCREYVTAWPEPSGVWAGTTSLERDRARRKDHR